MGRALSRGFGKTKGQTLHSTLYDSRVSADCHGVIRAVYVRQLLHGRQTWIRVGEHCDACQSFWPGAKRKSLRSIDRRRGQERMQAADDLPGDERWSGLDDLW